MEELTLKDLKAVLDDNELDLSMRQLSVLPVRALAKLPRATHLDFSNNQIVNIPLEFCLLTHITKLDLSNNRIVHLPSDFGKLSSLEHLDLYKNCVEELPLSFGELRSLKWLDMKGNPLEPELAKAAGECQDEKECKMAAVRVVKFMRDKAAEQDRLIQKQKELSKQREQTNATTTLGGALSQKEKVTKKKKNRHKEAPTAAQPSPDMHSRSNGPRMRKESKETPNRISVTKKPARSVISRVFGFVRKLFVVAFVLVLLGVALSSFIIFDNCTQKSHHWIPSSQPFCDDLHRAINNRALPPTFGANLYKTLSSMSWVYAAKLRELKADLEEGGYLEKAHYYWNFVYTKTVAAVFIFYNCATELFLAARKWYTENAAHYMADLLDSVILAVKMLLVVFSDLAVFIVEKGSAVLIALGDNIVYYMEHRDELLRTLQRWWVNMK
ncbi:Leucine-rich repeat-containing protein 59 [Toxocara canis]|uniref:Leucine-rich repeat-containing protein 59 n=1 Tax=Toxocara canis TaxID=6265 RepID=A0A0B2VQN6_TOXCA|nr:Leucine-rich repeat-containing protein 59 [Toxocara canis]